MHKNVLDKTRTSILQRMLLVLFGLFLCIVLLEIGLRLGGIIFLSLQEYRNKLSINRQGTFRIMCLGESTTAMGGRDSYPSQLEDILNQRNTGIRFSVINKGVPSISTAYLLNHLEENIAKYKPGMIITMIGINDERWNVTYGGSPPSKSISFMANFRAYKLARLMWLQILTKIRKNRVLYRAQSDQAEEELKKNIELNPRNEWLYIELGDYYKSQARYAEAKTTYKKAIELNPRNEKSFMGLGWCLRYYGNYAQAEEAFKKAIELNSKDEWPHIQLGYCYKEQNMPVQTEGAFKKAIELNPKNQWPYIELGYYYKDQGRYAEAEAVLKKAIEINPNDERIWGGLATLYQETGRYSDSKECYKKASELAVTYFNASTRDNYQKIKEILDKKKIQLVCVQYPVRKPGQFKKIFMDQEGIIFVDNEQIFKEAIQRDGYSEYFTDMFAGDFGHCNSKGNKLLAGNIANVILKEYFKK